MKHQESDDDGQNILCPYCGHAGPWNGSCRGCGRPIDELVDLPWKSREQWGRIVVDILTDKASIHAALKSIWESYEASHRERSYASQLSAIHDQQDRIELYGSKDIADFLPELMARRAGHANSVSVRFEAMTDAEFEEAVAEPASK